MIRAGHLVLLLLLGACDSPSSGTQATPAPSTSAHPIPPPPPIPPAPPLTDDTKAALAHLARAYRGTLSGNVAMRLYPDGARINGTYFSPDAPGTHTLSGVANGNRMTLDDDVSGARAGTLKLEIAPDGALSGTWSAAQGKSSPVHLESIPESPRPASAILLKHELAASKPVQEPNSKASCTLTVAYPEAFGIPAAIEAKLNADLAPPPDITLPEKCTHGVEISADYRVAHDGDGFVSIRLTSTIADAGATKPTPRGRTVNMVLAKGDRLKLFGDVVKPGAEKQFEAALGHQEAAVVAKEHLDENARGQIEQALGFSPPFVLEEGGIRLFPDALPPAYAAISTGGVLVPYAMLPKPRPPVSAMWR